MSDRQSHRIILSAGGTGGHIFPAVAVARELEKLLPGVEILFVGARGKMEMEKIPEAGYQVKGLWISGLERKKSIRSLLFPVKVAWSMAHALQILTVFRPSVVAGFGGYASGAILKAASVKRIPTLIQEQNSLAGITNRILAGSAEKICVAYEGMEKFFQPEKIIVTGNPVRSEISNIDDKKEEALSYFGFETGRFNVLVVGGSQGARSVNKAIVKSIDFFNNAGINLLWQTGKLFYEQARTLVDGKGINNIRVSTFIDRMDLAYAAADLVVSRAGAIALSEIALAGRPAVLIPLPTAAEDHQMKNALAYSEHGAAVVIPDSEAEARLTVEIEKIIHDDAFRKSLGENVRSFAKPDAAVSIAEEIIGLIRKKK